MCKSPIFTIHILLIILCLNKLQNTSNSMCLTIIKMATSRTNLLDKIEILDSLDSHSFLTIVQTST